MLLIAATERRHRAATCMAAHAHGGTVLRAASLAEACAYLERDAVEVVYRDRARIERCSVTGAVVMLDVDDGAMLCRRLQARGETTPILWVVPYSHHESALRAGGLVFEPYVLFERVDMRMLQAWLDHVRPARRACEARRIAREYELSEEQTEVLVAYAARGRQVALSELARQLELPESTLRRRTEAIRHRTGKTVHRLAAASWRHVG